MPAAQPELGAIHHLAYLVEELEPAARLLHQQLGAGPFFYLDDVPVTDVTSRGEPAEFAHGAAFGICNDVPVELMKIAKLAPARAEQRFVGSPMPRLHHVGYAVPAASLDAVREDLERGGLPEYLHSHFGEDVDMTLHDGSGSFGHDLELIGDSEGLRGFFGMVREAADGWEGSDLMRLPPG